MTKTPAEAFVIAFLNYIETQDILDEFDNTSQQMVRSAGVQSLVRQASQVFPRVKDGREEVAKIPSKELEEAIAEANNIIDRRDMFARKVQENGSARGLLEAVLAGDVGATELAREFLAAQNGEKEFYDPTSQ